MSAQAALARFRQDLLDLLDEAFIRHHGIYPDSGIWGEIWRAVGAG